MNIPTLTAQYAEEVLKLNTFTKHNVVGVPSTLLLISTLCAPMAAQAASPGWYTSFGVTRMDVTAHSDELVLSEFGAATHLALEEGPIAGSGVLVKGDTQPSVTIGYRFKSNPKLSFETIIAPPLGLDVEFTGTTRYESVAPYALGGLPTGIPAFGADFATALALPAVGTLVYNPSPDARFQPYVGIGMTYLYTFHYKITNETLTKDGNPKLKIDPTVGLLFQLGMVSKLSNRLSLVTDIKIGTGIKVKGRMKNISLVSPGLGDIVGPTRVGLGELSMKLDAMVLNASLKWKF